MDYQIALAPDLGLHPADFVADWNATDKARAIAEARFAPSSKTSYDPFLSVNHRSAWQHRFGSHHGCHLRSHQAGHRQLWNV